MKKKERKQNIGKEISGSKASKINEKYFINSINCVFLRSPWKRRRGPLGKLKNES